MNSMKIKNTVKMYHLLLNFKNICSKIIFKDTCKDKKAQYISLLNFNIFLVFETLNVC